MAIQLPAPHGLAHRAAARPVTPVVARAALTCLALLASARDGHAQRTPAPPAAVQGFEPNACRDGCALDTLQVDVERGRRAQVGVVNATLVLLDTVAQARRGGPVPPKEAPVTAWIACDSMPCGAAVLTAKVSDKRVDDARVLRRAVATWTLPAPLLARLLRSGAITVHANGRAHPLSPAMLASTRALVEPLRATVASAAYSPRMQLYIATFGLFGTPADSTMSEDVGTATEPLMMVLDANTTTPARVATLMLAGRGAGALPLLVQDDGTGAAPIFGVGEALSVALPGRTGRRATVAAKVVARQRVEAMRDSCERSKLWTYLVTLSPADLAAAQRGMVASPRPGDVVDRWNGAAVREAYPARMAAAEQRQLAAGRPVVAQFVKEMASSGVRDRDVQLLAVLPRGAGYVTNFGVISRDAGGTWHYPPVRLRVAGCPAN